MAKIRHLGRGVRSHCEQCFDCFTYLRDLLQFKVAVCYQTIMAGHDKDELVQKAKLSEQAERYDDMASSMKKVLFTFCL